MGDKQPRAQPKKAKNQSSSQDQSDGEAELSPSQILERVKPDRVTVTKPEEDRRRRTIIVEKSHNSYGFTLQSYGIHYKKEQEIEMITYVDYVEFDGPAYRAGMREGDVILSINGHDMEKTDHKTLVNFIKNCDSRMRMVVLFEDCVRKVELHMRYIQLQRILQSKMSELERICVKEKELLEGKWKTHSLPARKKGSKAADASLNEEAGYCRPMSTEDVARATPPPGFGPPLIAHRPYQYFDQHGRAYVIHGPFNNSREYIQAWPSGTSSRCDTPKGFARRPSAPSVTHGDSRGYHQSNGVVAASPACGASSKPPKAKSSRSHHCNPCLQSATSPQDNVSLEAYDLASPCCNSQCVPSRRRRHHHKTKKSSSIESARGAEWKEKNKGSQPGYATPTLHNHHQQSGRKYVNLVSQCSLHSCTPSVINSPQERMTGNNDSSAASYTTSLSTDTLYWEPSNGEMTRQHSIKSSSSREVLRPVKPKSWDNLTTKGFGGYGFGGYGYVERSQKPQSVKSARRSSSSVKHSPQPTKSSESLLLLPADYPVLSDSSLSCECLDSSASPADARFFGTALGGVDCFYLRDKASQTERRIVNVLQAPEVTRL